MKSLRQGKTKTILDSSRNSAILAVEIFNKPNTSFRIENYIILMIIAWTKLFHAYFQDTLGERYFYREKNGRYKKVDGERKAWELKECIKNYQKSTPPQKLSDAVIANLNFFIGIRNKIEHRHWESSYLDILLFGECQSLLFNYESLLIALFGENYSINTCLAYALQFSHLRSKEQIISQKTLLKNDLKNIKNYIDKYKTDLPQHIFDSQEFSVKLLQIPKVSNTNRTDLSIEFVNWSELDQEDKEKYQKVAAIIKDNVVKLKVSNADLLKPSHVIKMIEEKTGMKISTNQHSMLWKSFGVRPPCNSKDKSKTNDTYCIYDEPHNDYLYTKEWVSFLENLILKHKFTKEKILELCRDSLNINDYL